MARRYYENEVVSVTDLKPGAEVFARRVVTSVVLSLAQAVVMFDDGTSQTFELAGDPTVEIVVAGLK